MKENVFRFFSLLLGVGGLLTLSFQRDDILQTPLLSTIGMAVVSISFLLFAIGGFKLLSKSPLTKLLSARVDSIFTRGRRI
jgi:hypothetical protein